MEEFAKHHNKDWKKGAKFYRADTRFAIEVKNGYEIYPCQLIVAELKNGERYVYDLVEIKKPTLSASAGNANLNMTLGSTRTGESVASDKSIPQNAANSQGVIKLHAAADESNVRFHHVRGVDWSDISMDIFKFVPEGTLTAMGETEQSAAGLAGAIEKRGALRPWTKADSPADRAKPIAFDAADMVMFWRAVSGSLRNPHVQNGARIKERPDAIGLNIGGDRIEIVSKLFGEANGIRDLTPEMVATMTIEDVTDAIGSEMMSGREFGEKQSSVRSAKENQQIVRFSVAIPKGVKPSSNGRYNAGADNAGSVTDGHESRELTPKSAAPIRRFAQSISKSGTKSPRDFLIGIFNALGSKETNIDRSQYFSISRADKGSVSLRVANHRASAKTYLDNNNAADEKLSLVVKMSEKPFEPNGKVRLTEYVYFADKLTAEQETGIANAIANLIEGKNVVFPKAHQVNASPRVKKDEGAAVDEDNIRFSRATSPMGREVFVAGRARVAEDAERGERLPGVIAASAELSGQIHTPISRAGRSYLQRTTRILPTGFSRRLTVMT